MAELTPGQLDKLPKGQKVGQDLMLYDGKVMPQNFGQVMEFAQMMCKAEVAIPKHLRNNPGSCMAVIQRSMAWQIDPWAVASKTYQAGEDSVMSYEAQLIAAVVQKWAPVKEKVWAPVYTGEGPTRQCTITLHHAETNEEYKYTSPVIGPPIGKDVKIPGDGYVGIFPKNSPMWKYDPDQQLWYYSIRAMARRFWPGIILGVYDHDEARIIAMRDITPAKVDNFLNDDPAEETGEAEILPPAHKSGLTQVNDPPPHDPETGELLPSELEPDPAILNKAVQELEPLTPETIAANMVKSIKGFTDKVMLEEYQHENQVAINAMPSELSKKVRKALSDRHIDLEEL